MPLKVIVVHVDSTARCPVRTAVAARLALQHDAHLVGVAATGWSPLQAPAVASAALATAALDPEPARAAAATALAAFEAQAQALGVMSCETRLAQEEAGLALVLHGRCSDLIVVGQTRGQGPAPAAGSDVPEWVVLNGPAPVLVVPAQGEFAGVGRRVAVAWNGSSEARRAIGSALPVLRLAEKVHVFSFHAGGDIAAMGEPPGADMGVYLARHGANVEIDVDQTSPDAGQALIGAVAECAADLLVMGAYGRSRMREMLMGGASRTVLASMQVPVWMAH